MKWHPEVLATLLDELAAATKPMSSSDLSMKATTRMRRLVSSGTLTNEECMSPNYVRSTRPQYWEVTGSTVSSLLKGDERVVVTKRGNQNHFALRTRMAEWERDSVAAQEARAASDARITIRGLPTQIEIVSDNKTAVLIELNAVPQPYAGQLAEMLVKDMRRTLYRSLTEQEVWSS